MAKDVIHTHGEDVVVREDTAKAFRGVNWALISIGAFVVIAAMVAIFFFAGAATDGKIETPSQLQNANTNSRP